MSGRPSDEEMQRRIADLLMTPTAGEAVARRLQGQKEAMSCGSVVADLREKRLEAVCRRGLDLLEPTGTDAAYGFAAAAGRAHKERVH